MNSNSSNRRDFFLNPIKRFQAAMNEESPHNSDNFFENESDELADDMTSSLFSDFTHDDLVYEVMRLGLDPSNMGDKQMKALILEKLGLSRTNAKETKPNL